MNLAIFGATGRSGSVLVETALADGHQVHAFVRDPLRLRSGHPGLSIFVGQLSDAAAVSRAVANTEAVLSCLSAGNGVLTRFGETIIPILRQRGPRRILSMVGASLRQPGDPPATSLAVMSGLMRLVPGRMLADAAAHEAQLRNSGLDWTLVRSANHRGGAPGVIRAELGYAMKLSASVARSDLAHFMLSIATDGSFVGAAPMVESTPVR